VCSRSNTARTRFASTVDRNSICRMDTCPCGPLTLGQLLKERIPILHGRRTRARVDLLFTTIIRLRVDLCP
jgi:hypothetical protein